LSVIEIQNLTKYYNGITAVDNLSLEIPPGELFALLGPNGAGKSTTIGVISTLIRPSEGSVKVGGFDVTRDHTQIRSMIGVCPQEPAYYPFLTGRENIALFGQMHNLPTDMLEERIQELVEKIGMEDHADRKAREYSGGMVRRVSTVMALVHDPEIALLDEPTSSMDPVSRRAVWEMIREIKLEGKVIVLTTHSMEEAEALADRVAIINEGQLIALGSPQELIKKHQVENLEDVFINLTGKTLKEDDVL
jgi:ABC-2 type transport system ATP-binding protein